SFSGNGKVEVPSLKLPCNGELTIEAYITARKTAYGGALPDAVHLVGDDKVARLLLLNGHWSGYVFFHGIELQELAAPNERRHMALVRSLKQKRLFLQGRPVAVLDDPSMCPDENPKTLSIGAPPFDGIIDEVRISTTARYDKEFKPALRFEPD